MKNSVCTRRCQFSDAAFSLVGISCQQNQICAAAPKALCDAAAYARVTASNQNVSVLEIVHRYIVRLMGGRGIKVAGGIVQWPLRSPHDPPSILRPP